MQAASEEPSRRTSKLIAIGTLAGLFTGLFGVGGGSVIVPLLVPVGAPRHAQLD